MVGKWLFQIAKSPLTRRLVGMGFKYGSRLLPVRKVFCSKDFVCTPTQHKAAPSVYFQKVLHTIQRQEKNDHSPFEPSICGRFFCIVLTPANFGI